MKTVVELLDIRPQIPNSYTGNIHIQTLKSINWRNAENSAQKVT
jgi:hypothetical protein